jgi:hypothetical protein
MLDCSPGMACEISFPWPHPSNRGRPQQGDRDAAPLVQNLGGSVQPDQQRRLRPLPSCSQHASKSAGREGRTLRSPSLGARIVYHVGLFIPCYMDAFEPEVGIATLELLERPRGRAP